MYGKHGSHRDSFRSDRNSGYASSAGVLGDSPMDSVSYRGDRDYNQYRSDSSGQGGYSGDSYSGGQGYSGGGGNDRDQFKSDRYNPSDFSTSRDRRDDYYPDRSSQIGGDSGRSFNDPISSFIGSRDLNFASSSDSGRYGSSRPSLSAPLSHNLAMDMPSYEGRSSSSGLITDNLAAKMQLQNAFLAEQLIKLERKKLMSAVQQSRQLEDYAADRSRRGHGRDDDRGSRDRWQSPRRLSGSGGDGGRDMGVGRGGRDRRGGRGGRDRRGGRGGRRELGGSSRGGRDMGASSGGRDIGAGRGGRDSRPSRGGRDIGAGRGGRDTASRGGRDMASRGGRDMASRGGRDLASRGGRDMASRGGRDLASRGGRDMALRGGRDLGASRGGRDIGVGRGGRDLGAGRGGRDGGAVRGGRDIRPARGGRFIGAIRGGDRGRGRGRILRGAAHLSPRGRTGTLKRKLEHSPGRPHDADRSGRYEGRGPGSIPHLVSGGPPPAKRMAHNQRIFPNQDHFFCHICQWQCRDLNAFKNHMFSNTHLHSTVKDFKMVQRVSEYKKKEGEEGGEEEPPRMYQAKFCTLCKEFVKKSLVAHCKTDKHKEMKGKTNPQCKPCDLTFPSMGRMIRHCKSEEHKKVLKDKGLPDIDPMQSLMQEAEGGELDGSSDKGGKESGQTLTSPDDKQQGKASASVLSAAARLRAKANDQEDDLSVFNPNVSVGRFEMLGTECCWSVADSLLPCFFHPTMHLAAQDWSSIRPWRVPHAIDLEKKGKEMKVVRE